MSTQTFLGLTKSIRALLYWTFLVIPISACSNESQWKEEVLLSDGKTIVVDRGITFGPRNHELGQSATGAVKYWVSFLNPANGQTVRWENPGKLMPMILAISGGVPYVVAIPISAYGYIEAGCPDPAYLFFKYLNEWKSIPYKEFPQEARKRNFLLVYIPQELAPVRQGFLSRSGVASAHPGAAKHNQELDPNWKAASVCGAQFKFDNNK